MQQVIAIHGGETFDTYEDYLDWLKAAEFDPSRAGQKKWRNGLQDALGEGYVVLAPSMPNALNAHYEEWRIWFEKVLASLPGPADAGVILIGHSLGGIFLAKYLATAPPSRRVKATILVAAPFGDRAGEGAYSMADFSLPADLSRFAENAGSLHLFHSEDDPVVPFEDLAKYRAVLPRAELHVFHDRQHFTQEDFPELVETIRAL